MTGPLSLSAIENWSPGYLGDMVDYGRHTGQMLDENYRVTRSEINNSGWTGLAFQAAQGKAQLDYEVAQAGKSLIDEHGSEVSMLSAAMSRQKQTVGLAVDAAENAKFQVSDDGGVSDPNPPKDPAARAARQAQALVHRNTIFDAAAEFHAQDAALAAAIAGHTASLEGINFNVPNANLMGASQPEGQVQCFGPEQNTYCVEQHPDGSTTTFPGIPAMGGMGGPAQQWPDASKVGEGKVSMVDHAFKTAPPVQPTPAPVGPTPGGAPVGRIPGSSDMAMAPPSVVGPGAKAPDPHKHDPGRWELETDTGKAFVGAGGALLLPEAGGVRGPLSIGQELVDPPDPPKPGAGLKVGIGIPGALIAAIPGIDDATHTNQPEMKPDIIDNYLHDRPHFWDEPPNLPPGAKEVK
jgi:hypothetical protein